MKKSYFLKSVFTALALVASMQVFAKDVVVDLKDKMTYIDAETPDEAQYDLAQAQGYSCAGYNKINDDGQLVLAYKSWHRNWITLVQVDVSNIQGNITAVNFSIEGGGSTDSKRKGVMGVGTLDLAWSKDLTWNNYDPAENAFEQYGETVSSPSKAKDDFGEGTWDITEAFKDKKIVTLAVFATNAGGVYVQNPKVTISYTPADAKTAKYTVYFIDNKTGENIKDPETREGSVGASLVPTDADKASFTSADGTKKYTYVSAKAETDLTEDGAAELYIYYDVENIETGINQVSLSAQGNHVLYNLNGQRVDASYKGVVIKDGKKMLKK